MRSQALAFFLLPISSYALQIPSIFADFFDPVSIISNETFTPASHDLLKRNGNCPTNYNACSGNEAGACCTVGSSCTTDNANNVACCPTSAKCTGTVRIVLTTGTTTSGAVLGTGSTTTTTSTGTTATITSAASLVSNAYFPWPYIPTSYSNSAACMVAYSDCQSNYAACTAELEGGNGFGVTIIAPAGGVTVSPTAQSLGSSSATSICSSLYDVACYGIVPTNCNSFAATGFVAATGTTTNGAPGSRITAGAYAGLVVGGMGFIAGRIL